MEKLISLFDPKSPIPQQERQAMVLAAVMSIFYAIAAIYTFIVGATMLLQIVTGNNTISLSLAFGVIIFSLLLAAITIGMWRFLHWAITFSALILTAALIYSLLGDLETNNWLLGILKLLVIGPAIATGHMRLWRESQHRKSQASRDNN